MNPRKLAATFALLWLGLASWLGWMVIDRDEITAALCGAFILYAVRTAILELLESYFPRNFGDEQ